MNPESVLKMLKRKIESAAYNECNYAIETEDIEAINIALSEMPKKQNLFKRIWHFLFREYV